MKKVSCFCTPSCAEFQHCCAAPLKPKKCVLIPLENESAYTVSL